jgi:hypothetical protein
MSCPSLLDPACIGTLTGKVAGGVARGVLADIAHSIQSGIAWVVSGTTDWWVKVPSPDLASDPAVGALQRWMLPVTVAVAVASMIAAAGKMALTRKANPLVDVGAGLAVIAATSAVGVVLPALLLRAGDAWSSWVLDASTGGQFGHRLAKVLSFSGAGLGVVAVLGSVAIILAAMQAVLMLFRQAAVVILAGVLPLAAAGTLTSGSRAKFRRVTGWMLALIFYKPAAAAVYATAFTMIGTGRGSRTVLMGFAMLLLSLVALPALMRFFTWTAGTVEASASGGGFLSTMLSGAVAIGAVRGSSGGSGGASAADHARLVSAQLGQQSGAPQGASASGSPLASAPAAAGAGSQRASSTSATADDAASGTRAGRSPAGPGSGSAAPSGAAATAGAAAAGTAGAAAAAAAASRAAATVRAAAQATQPPGESE